MDPDHKGENRIRTATALAATTLIVMLSSNANGVDFPNVIGAWKVPERERSVTSYQKAQDAALMVKILRQDGESFSGTVIGLNGKTERIVGAFRRDASTFIYSSQRTAGMGKVQGNKMEICRTDAPCTLLIRSK
jgi:hypothetical protein